MRITVTHRHDTSFDVRVRGYALISDEPVSLGGEDEGPTPTELMIAGLAACTADAATRHLLERDLLTGPVAVHADFSWDALGRRITDVRVQLVLPADLSDADRESVLTEILRCPARLVLTEPPQIAYSVLEQHEPAPALAT